MCNSRGDTETEIANLSVESGGPRSDVSTFALVSKVESALAGGTSALAKATNGAPASFAGGGGAASASDFSVLYGLLYIPG